MHAWSAKAPCTHHLHANDKHNFCKQPVPLDFNLKAVLHNAAMLHDSASFCSQLFSPQLAPSRSRPQDHKNPGCVAAWLSSRPGELDEDEESEELDDDSDPLPEAVAPGRAAPGPAGLQAAAGSSSAGCAAALPLPLPPLFLARPLALALPLPAALPATASAMSAALASADPKMPGTVHSKPVKYVWLLQASLKHMRQLSSKPWAPKLRDA